MIDYDPVSEAVYDDPFPFYKRLRDEAPAYFHPDYECWFLSRFADIQRAAADVRSFSVTGGTTSLDLLFHGEGWRADEEREATGDLIQLSVVAMLDPPEHTRVRSRMNAPFKPAAVQHLEPFVRGLVREQFDRIEKEGRGDAVADLSGRVSVRVACQILGLPLENADEYSELVNGVFDRQPGVRGMTELGTQSSVMLHLRLVEFIQKRRASGRDFDGLMQVFDSEDFGGGRRLNDHEMAAHTSMVLIGGTETFPKVFSSAAHRLWQHPDQRARVAADPSLVPQAFHEALRYDMPTQLLGRTATRPVEFHGHTIEPGQRVAFLWASGNRDEREFERPDEFDVSRGTPRILSFGHGAHMCLGAHVARLEGRVLLEELLARMPEYEVVEEEAMRLRSEFFRGWAKLPIRF